MIYIRTLENSNIETILQAFNLAFSDYLIPMQITLDQLENKIRNENIKLEFSVGAFENKQLIAFILHGQNFNNGKLTLYNAGTGVIPIKRGNNLTLKLYEFLLPKLSESRTSSIKLEVITTNKPAINTYEKTGFRVVRELNCYKGILSKPSKSTYKITVLNNLNWEILSTFWDWIPTWQNNISAIENNKNEILKLGIFDNQNLIGYLIFNPASKRVQQFAVEKSYRKKGAATQLFNYIGNNYCKEISLINIESNDTSTISFLVHLGLEKTISQYEMVLNL